MCLRPAVLQAFAGFGNSVYPGGILEPRIKKLVILTAFASNERQFCTYPHPVRRRDSRLSSAHFVRPADPQLWTEALAREVHQFPDDPDRPIDESIEPLRVGA